MCSPHLSFLINKAKKKIHKDGMQSHSDLIRHYALKEENWVKVGYDWTTKTLDIIGENEGVLPFELKYSHYKAIDNFIQSKVGTKEALVDWLSKNFKDKDIEEKSKELFVEEALPKKKLNIDFIKKNFFIDDNIIDIWRNKNVSPQGYMA